MESPDLIGIYDVKLKSSFKSQSGLLQYSIASKTTYYTYTTKNICIN